MHAFMPLTFPPLPPLLPLNDQTKSRLGAELPRGEVFFLLRSEAITFDPHTGEFQRGNLILDGFRYLMNAGVERLLIGDDPVDRERLRGKTHIHYRSGVAFGCGKIHEAAFAEDVNRSIAGDMISFDIRAH